MLLLKTPRARLYAALLIALLLVVLSATRPAHAQEPVPAAADQATMTSRLAEEFSAAGDGDVTFLVILKDQIDLTSAAAITGTTQERAAVLYPKLTALASQAQASLRTFLTQQGAPWRAFYIVDMIQVTGDAALAQALLARPEVDHLAADPPLTGAQEVAAARSISPLPLTWHSAGVTGPMSAEEASPAAMSETSRPWGIDSVHAPEVWAGGMRGAGIVIGSQDTGVQWDHPALKGEYRGWNPATSTASHEYNWLDAIGADDARKQQCPGEPESNPQIPCDDYGHGTHTVGTMVGDATAMGYSVIGMAPDAQWIGCRNMSSGTGTPSSYATCFEFFLAPYPQGGDPFEDGKPEMAPNIINNSWGCPSSEGCDDPNILKQVVETSRAAGQFIAGSAGNNGSSCNTVDDPIAIYDATFSVGALNPDGSLASFSSRGPVTVDGSGRLKPDIAAPGFGVLSAQRYETTLTTMSGTSMASPHVAGAVALLWSAFPELNGDVDRTEEILRESATAVDTDVCGVAGESVSPNPLYGAGRLNVAAAVAELKPASSLTVTVVSTTGAPVPGVTVNLIFFDENVTVTARTNAAGMALFPWLFTTEWSGGRSENHVLGTGDEVSLPVGAPTTTWLPIISRREGG